MDDQKNSNKGRKVILKINGTKINQSRTSYSSKQRYLDMSQQKYKPFVVRLGTTDKFADIQIPQDEEDEREPDTSERYRKYFKIKKDMDRLTPKEFQKKYIWGGTRNPTQVKTEKARSAVISRRLRTNYDNYAYLHDVLDISTVSISGDPKLKELSLFCTEDLKQVLNTIYTITAMLRCFVGAISGVTIPLHVSAVVVQFAMASKTQVTRNKELEANLIVAFLGWFSRGSSSWFCR